MSQQKKRYRQAPNLRGQSSDKIFKIVSDASPFTHECPNCFGKFPAKSASFGKCMSVHINYCKRTRKQQRMGSGNSQMRDDGAVAVEERKEDEEYIEEEMMVELSGGEQWPDEEQGVGDFVFGERVEEEIYIPPAEKVQKRDLAEMLQYLDDELGALEEYKEESDVSDVEVDRKKTLCGACVVEVEVSDLPLMGPGWNPRIPVKENVRGIQFSKEEFLRRETCGSGDSRREGRAGGAVGRGAEECVQGSGGRGRGRRGRGQTSATGAKATS